MPTGEHMLSKRGGGGGLRTHPLALEDGLAILVELELGDDDLGGVEADVHSGAVHLQQGLGSLSQGFTSALRGV